ncbi:MAG: TonB-dependent receptor domain-containing protein [Vicinamibacterales bacterium]
MNRHFTLCTIAALVCVVAAAPPASAQFGVRTHAPTFVQASAASSAVVHGVVLDDQGSPLAGAVVSAFGSTSVFAVSDPRGQFSFRNVPYGPYVVRAHLQGYVPPRARLIQVDRASLTVSAIALTRRNDDDADVPIFAAGVGGADVPAEISDEGEGHDHGEVAWRLRHLKRSVLKDAAIGLIDGLGGNDFLGDSLDSLGRAIGTPARLASLIADVPWNGHVDLLTSTSFDRPQDLLSMQTWLPRGVAFVSLEAPTSSGHWTMRGAVNQGQGDLSSWILAASFQRAPAPHRYEAGLSYGMQSYLGGHVSTRSAVFDGNRNVGAVYAYDDWTITPRVAVNVGAKYARYGYLPERGLFSPRASVTVTPTSDDTFKVRAAISRRAVAPGAEEFIPPASGLWLPPERTFSAVSPRRGFTPEHLRHVELAAEREWGGGLVTGVRAFRQRVDDQLVTLFGSALPGASAAGLGHYYVASAGDVDARGWGVSVSRTMANRLRASVDYTHVDSTWLGTSPGDMALSLRAIAIRQHERERFHDVTTTVDSTLPVTDTHVFVMYKVNSRFDAGRTPSRAGARFDVQLNQALPFLNFAGAELEMLVAVRSLFRDELLDTSVYDEILAIRPPKRVVGGVTVRF